METPPHVSLLFGPFSSQHLTLGAKFPSQNFQNIPKQDLYCAEISPPVLIEGQNVDYFCFRSIVLSPNSLKLSYCTVPLAVGTHYNIRIVDPGKLELFLVKIILNSSLYSLHSNARILKWTDRD